MLALKYEIEELKDSVAKTKEFGTGEGGNTIREIPKWMNNPAKDGTFFKESNGKTYHWHDSNGEHDLI